MKHLLRYGGIYIIVLFVYIAFFWVAPIHLTEGVTSTESGNPIKPWQAILAAHCLLVLFSWAGIGMIWDKDIVKYRE